MAGVCLRLPLRRCDGRLFQYRVEVEAVSGNNAPQAVVADLPLPVVPLPVVDCFFGAMIF